MPHTIFHHLFISIRAIIKGILMLAIWLAFCLVGIFFWKEFTSPINLVLGLPLLLLGITMGLSSLYELIVGVISWEYGKTHCPFCESFKNSHLNQPPKRIRKYIRK